MVALGTQGQPLGALAVASVTPTETRTKIICVTGPLLPRIWYEMTPAMDSSRDRSIMLEMARVWSRLAEYAAKTAGWANAH